MPCLTFPLADGPVRANLAYCQSSQVRQPKESNERIRSNRKISDGCYNIHRICSNLYCNVGHAQQSHPQTAAARRQRAAEPPRSRISPWAVWLMGVPFVMVPLFVGLYLLGHNPIRPLMQALDNEEKLELQIEELEQENADLQQDVNALGPGQFGIEKRARERLGWSKPGEIVIHVPDKK